MWLAAVDPDLMIALAALITAAGGVSLPFLIPLATKRVKALEQEVAACEKNRTEDRKRIEELERQMVSLRRGSRGRR